MLDIILALLLILVGIILAYKIMYKKTPSYETLNSQNSVTTIQDKKTGKDTTENLVPLEELVLPSNFPSVLVIYFGSQTGTSEKFC